MLEIVFGESACGTLKIAQSYGAGPYRGGAVGVFLRHADGSAPTQADIEAARRKAEDGARRAWEAATPMGGKAADVHCIDLNLSEGDISEDIPGALRQAELAQKMHVLGDLRYAEALDQKINQARDTLQAAREQLQNGGEIRVWYSEHNPDEFCGFCWLMAQLQDVGQGGIRAVCLPRHIEEENSIVHCAGWGDVPLESWHKFVRRERTLSPVLRKAYASCWLRLRAENSGLRAVVNGMLLSVPDDFYDGFIRREIAAQEEKFHEARVIGGVIGKYGLGVGDGFIALRIEELLRLGELEAATQPEPGDIIYRRWLRKTGKFRQTP